MRKEKIMNNYIAVIPVHNESEAKRRNCRRIRNALWQFIKKAYGAFCITTVALTVAVIMTLRYYITPLVEYIITETSIAYAASFIDRMSVTIFETPIASLLTTLLVGGIILILYMLIIVNIAVWLGTPKNANNIANSLAVHFRLPHKFMWPILISIKTIPNTDMKDFLFDTRWVSVEKVWKPNEELVLKTLKMGRVEDYIQCGKGYRRLIIRTGVQAERPIREGLYDE
jgi:hypothetical protein